MKELEDKYKEHPLQGDMIIFEILSKELEKEELLEQKYIKPIIKLEYIPINFDFMFNINNDEKKK